MQSIAYDFPEIAKSYSIGKSFEGRDINVIEMSLPSESKDRKPAILMTGATHARELISTNLNVFQMLKLLRLGAIENDSTWKQLFQQNKYIFMPIFNVDGVNFIEENWNDKHKIIPKRKNMDNGNSNDPEKAGVDLNRQFAIDFGQIDSSLDYASNDWGVAAQESKKD